MVDTSYAFLNIVTRMTERIIGVMRIFPNNNNTISYIRSN